MAVTAVVFSGHFVMAQGGGRGTASPSPYPTVSGKAYKFETIAEGVYYATATGSLTTGSNNTAIVGDREVMVVDTGNSPAAARAFIEDLKVITDKPIRWVVNTHFHYDHTDGNQVYAGHADIIGHDYVKYAMEKLNVLHREPYQTSQLTNVPNRIASLKKQLAAEQDATKKAALQRQLTVAQEGLDALQEIKPTPPNKTFAKRMDIKVGRHDVQLLFLGRDTNSDIVVFLPQERVVVTGDLMASVVYGRCAVREWVTTLEARRNSAGTLLPGHGARFTTRHHHGVQGYLTDLVRQGTDLKQRGVSAEEAARRADLTAYRSAFPAIQRQVPTSAACGASEWIDGAQSADRSRSGSARERPPPRHATRRTTRPQFAGSMRLSSRTA